MGNELEKSFEAQFLNGPYLGQVLRRWHSDLRTSAVRICWRPIKERDKNILYYFVKFIIEFELSTLAS